jgi:hypothetical protein
LAKIRYFKNIGSFGGIFRNISEVSKKYPSFFKFSGVLGVFQEFK